MTLEIRDDVGFCVFAIEECPDARRENVKKREPAEYIPAGNGNWVRAWWRSLTPTWYTSEAQKSHPKTELLPLRHVSSFERVENCRKGAVIG
jgi:hypothetical protein